jgi:hypothetical protein
MLPLCYRNVFPKSDGENKVLIPFKSSFKKLFLSTLVFHLAAGGYPQTDFQTIPKANHQISQKYRAVLLKDKHTGA